VRAQVAEVQASVLVQACDEPFVLGCHLEVRLEAHLGEILAVRMTQEVQGGREDREDDLGQACSCRKDQEVEVHVREVDRFHDLADRKADGHRNRGLEGRTVFFRQGRVVEDPKDAAHLAPYRGDDCHFGGEGHVVEEAYPEASGIVDLPMFQGASLARGHKD
jgi:hypothetical protein